MASKKKTTTSSTQNNSATTTLPAWMTDAGQANYGKATDYIGSEAFNWSPAAAAAYRNPYIEEVQDRTVARMGRQNQVDHEALNDNAQGAKAFGGTRHAVLEAAQGRDQSAGILDYLAGSNADAYSTARGEFNQDRAAKLGGYSTLAHILGSTPRNTTTTGTQSGTGTSTQQGSWIDTVLGAGQIAAAAFSDPRLKTHVSLIARLASGLGVYRFRYVWDRLTDPLRVGVMANEVATLAPHALGPIVGGYLTVNYEKLGNLA